MCKKLLLLTSVVLALGFASVNYAADIVWSGRGADNLWSNPANWEGNKVPTAADDALIEVPGAAPPNGPLIQDGIDAVCSVLWNEVAGEPEMRMTGGTLTMSGWGIWWGDGPGCNPTFYQSGGVVSLTGSPGVHEFGWGGSAGTWIMTGGTVNTKGVSIPSGPGNSGEIQLHGGTYNVGTARGGLVMRENSLINITAGTLVLEGDVTANIDGFIAEGKITAYGGAGQLDIDFDVTSPGFTTVTAIEAGKAYKPNPADGAIYEDTWASLSWSPADGTVSHDVYFGEDFDQVSTGAADTFRGNQGGTFYIVGFPGYPYPDGLVPGTTYYWRIDEIEADGTINGGDVWSFTIPPKTAFNPAPADGAEFVAVDAELGWMPGFGAVLHTVYFGDSYDDVSNATGGTSQGAATFTPGPLEREKVYYWRVDEFDAADTYKGDVWAFSTPGAVGSPSPANGATGVQMNATLSWTPGQSAASSDVYFGTDKDAVRSATTSSPEYKGSKPLGSETYDPAKLAWKSIYYWRVDGVESLNPASPWKGNVWSFETADFITVDDFESYNDLAEDDPASNRIYLSWIDGLGTTTNGSVVGYADLPLVEHGDVHGGGTSMPYSYDNNLKYSEANATLTYPRDWTEEGVGVLSLWFKGNASNAAEPMYVVLNGSAAVYHDDSAAAQIGTWTQWTIDLQDFAGQGVDLTNVNSIGIGFGNKNNVQAGDAGKMLFDDIALYRAEAPAEATAPVGWWKLDGNADDSSAAGLNGTPTGGPTWVAGVLGEAMELDGIDDYVDCGNPPSLDFGSGDFTVSAWIRMTTIERGTVYAKGGDNSGGIRYTLAMGESNNNKMTLTTDDDVTKAQARGATVVNDGVWHHVVGMRSGNTAHVYVDGALDGSIGLPDGYDLSGTSQQNALIGAITSHPDGALIKFFAGTLDDVRVYDKALSDTEIATLASGQ